MGDPETLSPVTATGRALAAGGLLFENGPLQGLRGALDVANVGPFGLVTWAIICVAIGWVPLFILSVLQSLILHTQSTTSFLWDAGVHARYLLATPLLILAEGQCATRLNVIAHEFAKGQLIRDKDRLRYEAAIASTRRMLSSTPIALMIVGLAYLFVLEAALSQSIFQVPDWHQTGGMAPVYSPAGWWHVLVSLPLLLILLLGWMWRLAVWARLLWKLSRLDLRLMTSHPDRAGGLGFAGYSIRAFSIVAMALTTILAGHAANTILSRGALSTQFFITDGCVILGIAALFAAPLLVFTPVLLKAWQQGTLGYGALAHQVGLIFEHKWLHGGNKVEGTPLGKQDFSATIDLYSIVANAYALQLLPIDNGSIFLFGAGLLLPFLPIALLTLPADHIMAAVVNLLF